MLAASAASLAPSVAAAQRKPPKKSKSADDVPIEDRGEREQAWEETDELPAVQNRRYQLHHEFQVGGGVLPIDPYTKGYHVTGGYTFHIDHLWAIEGLFSWVFNVSSSLRDKLEGNFGEPASKFVKTEYFGMLGALFKPLYGKLAFLNDTQVYGEVFLSTYAVFAQLNGGEKTDEETSGRGRRFAVGVAPGVGIRGFVSRYFSLRFDINWMVLFSGGPLSTTASPPFEVYAPLSLRLTVAFTTRGDL